MRTFRRFKACVALVTQSAFLFSTIPARAQSHDENAQREVRAEQNVAPPAVEQAAPKAEEKNPQVDMRDLHERAWEEPATEPAHAPRSGEERATPAVGAAPPAPQTPMSLPSGADKTGVSSQAISVPQGAGKIQGMGESFSMQLSTGVGTFSVPFALPAARGGVSPALGLSYSSSAGHGLAGVGWDIGVPFIARQTDRGLPSYRDPLDGAAWQPAQDRFIYNGGQELVPICLVTGTTCDHALPSEAMPAWANGWQYFRPRVEGAFLRFFWSPNHRTWRVQSKSGENMELGAPLDGSASPGTLEVDPLYPSHIFRWNLARQYDAQGAANPNGSDPVKPVNVIVYRYMVDGANSYLTDIYDTPPALNSADAAVSTYAHHTRLRYEWRPDATLSYRRGWQVRQALRLVGLDVTSKTFQGDIASPRKLVRRYHLAYDANYHASFLSSVQVEGRCGKGDEASEPVAEDGSESLPNVSCPTLPAMTFGYQHVAPYATDGSAGTSTLPGFEGFDERVTAMTKSPPHSLDEEMTDLFDVSADGLPDVVVTSPGEYNGRHGLYLNGVGGQTNAFGASTIGVTGILGETESTITLRNANLSPADLDGDGIIDLVHMPQVKTYSVYTPQYQSTGWMWMGRPITTAAAQSPKIDFGKDAQNIQHMDVNGDGLVDVVVSTGLEMETFYSLGKYPGGDGQFGHATWTGPTTATISNDPIATCVPYAGTPVQFSGDNIKLGDMNGDGLTDIIKLTQGDIRYWPGRGNGVWGTGDTSTCVAGTFGASREIAMTTSPQYSDPNASDVRIDDVNGDGLDDLVQVRQNDVDVWLNVDGTSWTTRHTIKGTPAAPSFQHRVRLVDMNGSGTRDILWGDGNQYRFIDLQGGARPGVLNHVANGLGKTTDLEYASSVSLMLAAEKAGTPWQSKMPIVTHVVTKVTDSDNLEVIGRPAGKYVTEYRYSDPVYDGRQREFRGFRTARATKIGDANSPTSSSDSTFLLGECLDEEPAGALPSPCTFAGRWRDNPREALKGLPIVTETFDESNVYSSTAHDTYRLRVLYAGLDGREVRHAFQSQTDSWIYDTAAFDHKASSVSVAEVELDKQVAPLDWRWDAHSIELPAETQTVVTLRAGAGRAHLHTAAQVDAVGNAVLGRDDGCVDGCPDTTTSGGAGAPRDGRIAHYSFVTLPQNDHSAWAWRSFEEYTLGDGPITESLARRHRESLFDERGEPTTIYEIVYGTLPLDRFHEGQSGAAPSAGNPSTSVAAPPAEATVDGGILVSYMQRDPLGNVTHLEGANHRCRDTEYDPAFGQLATRESISVGTVVGTCGSQRLDSTAMYDRGFGAVSLVSDVHLETSAMHYDGFGRIVSLTKPDPDHGFPSSLPSMTSEYLLTQNPVGQPYSIVHVRTQDGLTVGDDSYRESWTYVDGMGRTIVTLDQADVAEGDDGPWIASGLTNYDAKGAAERAYLAWFFGGDPAHYPLATAPATPYSRQRYDSFGRGVQTFGLDGSVTVQHAYHALSDDVWDAADLAAGPHQGTYASETKDGHGRVVVATERVRVGGKIEAHETHTQYLSTSEPVVVTRVRAGSGVSVTRWMRYDTAGRMVLNVEPNASKGFVAAPALYELTPPPATLKGWRYAYNDAGDLVGTSDPRGCGSNYIYEGGGRLVGEDYSPCLNAHAPYTQANPTTGEGFEVLNHYDTPDPDAVTIPDFAIDSSLLRGRLTSVSDRASKSVTRYDARGHVTGIARRVARPDSASSSPIAYARRWYTQTVDFDSADRPLDTVAGAVDGEASAREVTSKVSTTYTKRGLVRGVGSDHGAIVDHVKHDADGLALEIGYADAAKTTTSFSYDARRRLKSVQTYRGPPPIWSTTTPTYSTVGSTTPSTLQLLLEDLDFAYDAVDNPTEIRDWRTADEWPAGAKPVTRKMQYDDLYRVTRIDYVHVGGDDAWTSPFDAEDRGTNADSKRAKPSPHVSFDKRVSWQTFDYDWLGNTTDTADDAHGFYDRSLGTITNGTANAGPYQLKSATNATSTPGSPSREGTLTAAYDDAGNMTGLGVKRDGPCLPATPVAAICSQLFAYDWDEVGRLARARRWDLAAPDVTDDAVLQTTATVDLRYGYDATDDRTIKTAVDAQGNAVHTLYPLDALELRRTTWDTGVQDYARTTRTQVAYLFAQGVRLGRIVSAEEDLPSATSGAAHVFLELLDHLGSTSLVIDQETSELVEQSTYQGYGGVDGDYRPERWKNFREDYRFTGKEEDIEVGLSYFGKRYYMPGLGRWMSADPLAIHIQGADANVYAYVRGRALCARDKIGLEDKPGFWSSFLKGAKGSGENAMIGTGEMNLRAVGAIGSPDAVRADYYKALSEGRYKDAAGILVRSHLDDNIVSHVVKGGIGVIKATGEGCGDLAWHAVHGDSAKAGEAAGRTLVNATVLFLSARALLKAAPEGAEKAAPRVRPKPTAQEIADMQEALDETRTTTVRVFHKGELADGKVGDGRTLSTGTDEASVGALDRPGKVHAFDIPKEKLNEWLREGKATDMTDYDNATGAVNAEIRFNASLAPELNKYKVPDAAPKADGAAKSE